MKNLTTPKKIQDFLDKIPFNHKDETYLPPREMLERNSAHCFEGAVFAAHYLKKLGIPNFLIDFKVKNLKKDSDHVICAFKINGYWGAISKTNHPVLRWRDPIYKTPRELAMSFYHEYFLDNGEKNLKSFSKPFDIWKKFGKDWAEGREELDAIAEALDRSPHINFVPPQNKRHIRKAGQIEIKGASIEEWKK